MPDKTVFDAVIFKLPLESVPSVDETVELYDSFNTLSFAAVCQLSSKFVLRLISNTEPSYNYVGSASTLPTI